MIERWWRDAEGSGVATDDGPFEKPTPDRAKEENGAAAVVKKLDRGKANLTPTWNTSSNQIRFDIWQCMRANAS